MIYIRTTETHISVKTAVQRWKVGEVGMSETIITLCVLGAAAVACIIELVVITFREKKMKKKPTYYSAVGNWLNGRRL